LLRHKRKVIGIIVTAVLIFIMGILPKPVSGEVQPIEEMEQKLEGITEEEKAILMDLFAITQEIEELEREEKILIEEISSMEIESRKLEEQIHDKQKDYDAQLEILKQVLVEYQRGGPANYLEILLQADNLTTFLKSINIMKDISHNTGELLSSLEEGKKVLEAEKEQLNASLLAMEKKKTEQQEKINEKLLRKKEQEDYLANLREERDFYQEQLTNLEQMWDDSKKIFAEIVTEISKTIGEGYFTAEDLSLSFTFTSVQGILSEDTLNEILKEHSGLSETIFHFNQEQVSIEVPEKHLILTGNFVMEGDTAIRFEAAEGSFFAIPLEPSAIEDLFRDTPLSIDFKKIAGDAMAIDFTLDKIECREGFIAFAIKIKW
jgi:peptidoglycan hydrolase CwlO-like protein